MGESFLWRKSMEKWKAALVVCFLLAGQAFGAEPNDNYLGLFRASNWEIGPEIFYQRYSEPGLMKNTGVMYGVHWLYNYRGWLAPPEQGDENEAPTAKPAKWMIGTEGSISYGQVEYDGHLMNGTPYTMNGMDNWMVELRLLLGPDFPKENRVDTLYTGFGFRYLNNGMGSDPAGYDRQSRYFYLPAGITTLGKLQEGWLLGVTAEFDVFLYGLQSSDLGSVGGSRIDNPQYEGYGLRGSIKLGKKDKGHSFMVEPFIRYWQIQTSEESSGGVEPENNTTEVGARLIWRF